MINRRHILLAVVLVILAGVVYYRFQNPFVQQTTDRLTYTNASQQTVSSVKHEVGPEQKVSALELFLNKPQASAETYKNLFAEYQLPVKKRISVKPPPKKEPEPAVVPAKPDPLAEARAYLSSFTLYGTFKDGRKSAIFLSRDKQVMVARSGDRLDGKYLIQDIQDAYITFKVLGVNQTLRLDMREFKNE